jgi:hypothetical protein
VGETREKELRAWMKLVLDEAAEKRRSRGAIKAMVMIKDSNAHEPAW